MAMRHLITGQNNCAPDGASSSNPFRALANAVFGQSSKAQSIKELPGAAVSVPTTSNLSTAAPLSTIPGSENEFKHQRPLAQGTDFIRGGLLMIGLNLFGLRGFLNFEGQKHALKN